MLGPTDSKGQTGDASCPVVLRTQRARPMPAAIKCTTHAMRPQPAPALGQFWGPTDRLIAGSPHKITVRKRFGLVSLATSAG